MLLSLVKAKLTVKKLKYSQGMTLIEVLIASVILFIAVSAMSFVARSSALHEKRLISGIDRAMLAEFIRDEVSYQYQYEDQSQGTYKIGSNEFAWNVKVLESKLPMRFISSESSGPSANEQEGLIVLYEVTVTLVSEDEKIMSFKDVYWKN